MRVILELVSGSDAGRRVSLLRNQEVVVGQSSWADFAVADDAAMAEKHFRLETDLHACRVIDLSGGRGVWVNGEPAAAATIRNGDRIRAGRTDFVCHVEGFSEDRSAQLPTSTPVPVPVPPAELVRPLQTPAVPLRRLSDGRFKLRVCATGVYQFSGSVDSVPPAELVQGLARLRPLNAMVDYRRLEAATPVNGELSYLFDWLGAAAEANSPVLLHASDGDLLSLVEAGWGRNAVVCMFWQADKQAVVSHLRSFLRTGQGQVVGLCWPNILDLLLEYYHRDFVQGLIQPLAGFFLECASDVNLWRLYSKADMSSTLRKLGLTPIEQDDE
jgi:hypothetical protein